MRHGKTSDNMAIKYSTATSQSVARLGLSLYSQHTTHHFQRSILATIHKSKSMRREENEPSYTCYPSPWEVEHTRVRHGTRWYETRAAVIVVLTMGACGLWTSVVTVSIEGGHSCVNIASDIPSIVELAGMKGCNEGQLTSSLSSSSTGRFERINQNANKPIEARTTAPLTTPERRK